MRTISANDLAGLKRKGGVKVKRRLGTKKPEPEAEAIAALSGAEATETPVPASNEMLPVMEKLVEVLARMEARDRPTPAKSISLPPFVPNSIATKPAAPAKAKIIKSPVESVRMSALRPAKPSAMEHVVSRSEDGYMDEFTSTSESGVKWTSKVVRMDSKKKLIVKVISISNSGLKLIHEFQRNKQALIESVVTTPV